MGATPQFVRELPPTLHVQRLVLQALRVAAWGVGRDVVPRQVEVEHCAKSRELGQGQVQRALQDVVQGNNEVTRTHELVLKLRHDVSSYARFDTTW